VVLSWLQGVKYGICCVDEVVERGPGAEEEASLDGAASDEDEGWRVGDVAKFSGHTSKERKKSPSSLIRSSPTCDKPCAAGLQRGIPAGLRLRVEVRSCAQAWRTSLEGAIVLC
jgi:hypothetical protein